MSTIVRVDGLTREVEVIKDGLITRMTRGPADRLDMAEFVRDHDDALAGRLPRRPVDVRQRRPVGEADRRADHAAIPDQE